MRKLSKLKLKEFQEMSSSEMKNVVGGYQIFIVQLENTFHMSC